MNNIIKNIMKNIKFDKTRKKYLIVASVILAIFIINILYTYITAFEKVVTIKDKYNITSGNRSNSVKTEYMIVDDKNTIYKITNLWWRGEFDKAGDWALVNKNETYKLRGYSYRVPILGMYPNVYSLSKV